MKLNVSLSTTQADLNQLKADPSKIKDSHLFDDSNKESKALGLTECAGGAVETPVGCGPPWAPSTASR